MTDEVERILALMMLGDGVEMHLMVEKNARLFDHHVIELAHRFALRGDGKDMRNYRRNLAKLHKQRSAA